MAIVPMVSSDGESHEVLTMVAVGSGLIVAIIVLLILIVLIDCQRRNQLESDSPHKPIPSTRTATVKRKPSIFSVLDYNKDQSGITIVADLVPTQLLKTTTTIQISSENEENELNKLANNNRETVFSDALPGITTISC